MQKRIISIFLILLVALSGCATSHITVTEKNEVNGPEVTERAMSVESSTNTKIVINPESQKSTNSISTKAEPNSNTLGSGEANTPGFISAPVEDVVIGSVSEYFPLIMNSIYYYKNENGKSVQRYLQYVRFEEGHEITQLRISGEGTDMMNVLELTPDSVKILYNATDNSYRENIIGRTSDIGIEILKAPLEKGNKWETNGIEAEIISTDKKIKVNDFEMNAIVVKLFIPNREVYEIDYVKNLGPYKVTRTIVDDNGNYKGSPVTILEFKSLMYNQSEKVPVKFYFPESDGKYSEVIKDLYFDTNDITRSELKDSYVSIAESQGKQRVLTDDSRIQFLFIKDGSVHLDLNDAFINYVNKHPDEEKRILTALIKTITEFYKSNRLYLTVNDQRYESNSLKIEKTTELNSKSFNE